VDEKKKVVRKSLKLACSLTVELQLCIRKERKKKKWNYSIILLVVLIQMHSRQDSHVEIID
jgi:hypothetical protein